ncbi:MAG: hypothetical protein GX046_09790 [Tissierellia bacterium]|nr:hypothetical protein [Tissierellia bacterium]
MKRRMTAFFLIFLLLVTNLVSWAELPSPKEIKALGWDYTTMDEKLKENGFGQSSAKEENKWTLNLLRILIWDEERIFEKEVLEMQTQQIQLKELIGEEDAFKGLNNFPGGPVQYLGYRSKKGDLEKKLGEINVEDLVNKDGIYQLVLEYELKQEEEFEEELLREIHESLGREIKEERSEDELAKTQELEDEAIEELSEGIVEAFEESSEDEEKQYEPRKNEDELKHIDVFGEQALYQIVIPGGGLSLAALSAGGSKNVKVIPIDPSGSWAFFHVWDKTKDPVTGVTSTFAYFELDDGSIGFCLHPGLSSPHGNLPVDIFSNSTFRDFAEKVATLAISSGGLPGYSFEENFVFAQMYIWKNIPFSSGPGSRYALDFRYQHSPFEQNTETTSRYLGWKEEIDRKINSLGQISFDGDSLELEVGKEYKIIDKNSQLFSFNIKGVPEGLAARKEGNTLILKATKPLETRIEFWQARGDYPLPEMTFVLKGPNNTYQDLGVFKDPFVASLNVKARQGLGKLKIIKKDEGDKLLPGAVFEISGSSDFKEVLEELITAEDGAIESKEYPVDRYPKLYIREKSVPEPYIRSKEIMEVTLEAGATIERVYTNAIKKVRLSKTDFVTGNPVPGAVIELTDALGNKTEYTTDSQGRVDIIGLKSGTYIFREILSPQGYILNPESFTFSIDEEGSVSGIREFVNEPTRLRIIKTDNKDLPLSGAGFEVYFSGGEKDGKKLLANYDELKGRYCANAQGSETVLYSDEKGEVFLDYLPQGSFIVREVKAPLGFKLGTEGYGVEKSFAVDEEGLPSTDALHFVNAPTEVVLTKKDIVTGQAVAGATIELTDEEGSTKSYSSDGEGLVRIVGLKPGNYQFKEILAPRGYVLNKNSFRFTIDQGGSVSGVTEFTNEPTRLHLIKKDKNTGKPLAGAGFEVYFVEGDSAGEVVKAIYDKENNRYVASKQGESLLISDDKGQVFLDYLPQGQYRVIEKKAAAGYSLAKDPSEKEKKLIIDDLSNGQGEALVFFNEPTEVILTKKDMLTGKPLAGAEIEIIYGGKAKRYTTDEKGQIKLVGLNTGSYTFKEKKQPSGYILEKESFVFFLDEKGDLSGVKEFTNEPTRLIIQKNDEKNKAMEGVEFELIDSQGKAVRADYDKKSGVYQVGASGGVKSFITGDKGRITIDYLPQGQYLLKELRAPQGYNPIGDKKILIKDHGVTSPLVLDIVNKRELPKTGHQINHFFLIMTAIFILLGYITQKRSPIK